jgi:3-mercaptopyruvate sulfurtransferase SseA
MSNIEDRGYVHPEVLVSTDWVAAHLNDQNVRLVDTPGVPESWRSWAERLLARPTSRRLAR